MSDLPLLIIILLLVAFILRVDFIYYIVYVTLGVYILSRWYGPRSLRHLTIDRSYQSHSFLGEPVWVKLCIYNHSKLPIPWLQITESIPTQLLDGPTIKNVLNISGLETRTLAYKIRASRRGYYRLGPLLITTGDLFGFNETQARLKPDFLTVYPKIIPITNADLTSKLPFGTTGSNRLIFEDPARPFGVREYSYGDSLRHINWKASAHSEKMLLKTYQPAISLETLIVLNLNAVEYERRFRYDSSEWAVVVAASVATYLSSQRHPVGFATNGADPFMERSANGNPLFDDETGRLMRISTDEEAELATPDDLGVSAAYIPSSIPPKPGQAHLMKILELLARIEFGRTVSFASWLPQVCVQLSWGVTILAISPTADEATSHTLHQLVRAGYNVVLFVVEPYTNFSQIRERANYLGFSAYHIAGPQDLKQWNKKPTLN